MHERWETLEADFARFYSLDLSESITASPRRTLSLVRGLPPDSAIARSLLGGHVWTFDQELAAAQVELLHGVLRTLAAGFGVKRHKIPKPLEVPRPKMQPVLHREPAAKTKRNATVREMIEMLDPVLSGKSHG